MSRETRHNAPAENNGGRAAQQEESFEAPPWTLDLPELPPGTQDDLNVVSRNSLGTVRPRSTPIDNKLGKSQKDLTETRVIER